MKQATKTLISSLVFLLVAGALAFAAAWVGRDEEKKTEQKDKAAKLFEIDKGKVREVRLSKGGALVAAFKRDSQSAPWKIVEPVQADADDAAVTAIIDKLESLKQKSEVEGMDPKSAGLGDEGKARFAATVTEEGGKASTLLVGEDNPFDQSLYVKKPGDKVLRIVQGYDKSPLEKELFDLRDKRVAHLDDAAEIRKIEFTPEAAALVKAVPAGAGNFAWTLERDGGSWKLSVPPAGAADGSAADKVISAVKGLRATRIAEEKADEAKLKEYGLAFPKAQVALTVAPPGGKDTFQRKLLLGQPPRGSDKGGAVTARTYAKRDDSPTVFEVDGQILKDLSKELFDLQDKTVVKIDREAVRRIEYGFPAAGQQAISVARHKDQPADGGTADETFEVLAPTKGPAKKWKVSGNLFTLAGLRAAAFGDPAPKDAKGLAKYGLDQPRSVTLFGEKNAVLAKILIGAETGAADKRRNFVLVEGSRRIVEVEKSTFNDLPGRLDEVLDAPPPPPPPAMSLPDGGTGPAAP